MYTHSLAYAFMHTYTQGTNQSILISDNLDTPSGLAFDWITNKLYWTEDSYTERIEVANLDGSDRAILVFGDFDKLGDIVVHPLAG